MSAIFPFKNIHLASSSNDLEIAQNTLQQYLFNADAGHEFLPVIAARLGHPLMWRTTMFNYIQYMQCFNQGLLNYYNIHGNRDQVDGNEKTLHPYLEGSGTLISATTEMLLQSTESRIQVFPAIPEHWHASFELKSMSGITVESQHVAQQGVSFIKLHNPHERDISIDLYIPWKECYIFQSGNCQFLEFKKGFDLHVVIPSETSLSLSESPLKEAPQIQPKLHEKISPCRLGNTWYGLKGVANNHTTGFPLW